MTTYKIIESEVSNDVYLFINGEEWASWSLTGYKKHTKDILYQMMNEVAIQAKNEAKAELRKVLGL